MSKIILGVGLDNIKFGMTREEVVAVLGNPDETEEISYTDNGSDFMLTYHYDELEASLGFDQEEGWKLVTIGITDPEFTLDGKKLIGLDRHEAQKQLAEIKITDIEYESHASEENPGGGLIASYEKELNIWLEADVVSEIQWGPYFNEDDSIAWPE